ncbi:LysE family translocator [Mixta calida]|uniref:LysE family translocator n=1 Tax=Mixta calida TaxID=665913 RepID=UPI00137DAC00|nr:LysE family translocator [Mixta calida]KAF0860219.1 lysine transporter LysE [Mixta calida B021323]MDU5769941.1 LysE family translocator [Mixta calida]MDU5828040.1 LysE family translocator [Mixta calida]MDU6415189.1 LysE family translocator [Mixta calida]
MISSLLAFLVAIVILTLTPGFDTALVLRTSAAHGGCRAFASALGVSSGCFVWGVAVSFGLGALLLASEAAYNLLKWAGAAYLLWLGVGLLLRPRSALPGSQALETPPGWMALFVKGLFGNLLNPKVGIFYVSFLPQFIPANASVALWSSAMAFTHALIGLLWSGMLIMGTRYFAEKLRRPAVMKAMDRLTGCVFIGFAAKLALSRR